MVGAHHHVLIDPHGGLHQGADAAGQAGDFATRGRGDGVVATRVDGAADRVFEPGDGDVGRQ